MRTAPRPLALCLTLAVLLPALAAADDGMPLARVQEICGAPTQQLGDRWIYDRGPDKFAIIIHVAPDNTVGMSEEKAPE